MHEHEVDIEDLKTIDYDKIYAFVEKSAGLEKSINKLRAEKTNLNQNNELKDLVDRFQAPLKIPKEKKLLEPVVSQPIISAGMNNKMDKMAQQLQDLNVSIGAMIRYNTSRGQYMQPIQAFQPMRAQGTYQYQQRGFPHSIQVRMKTSSTKFDKNIENLPKKKEVGTRTGAKGALSFVNEDSDEKIEGYGVVNVYSVTEENAAQMERPEPRAKWPKPTEVLEEDEMEAEKPEEPKPVPEKKPRAKPRAKPVPKRRFIDDLKERSNAEELLEEIMNQKVSIRLRDIDEVRFQKQRKRMEGKKAFNSSHRLQ
jgi:hypothetical protein